MRRSNRAWAAALLTALAMGAWVWCAAVAQKSRETGSGIEARWESGGVSPAQVERAERWALEDGKEELPSLTLWREKRGIAVEDDGQRTNSNVIFLYGDGALAWPARFLRGGYPLRGDGEGIAISSTLADALWGSTQAIGRTVTIDGRHYHVRGVFQENSPLVLAQDTADSEEVYDHLTILTSDGGGTDSAGNILNGYGFPGAALTDFPFYGWCLTALASLPGFLLGIRLLLRLWKRGKFLCHSPILLLQYALPALAGVGATLWAMGPMEAIPGRLIPTRWSDFTFWAQLAGEFLMELENVFSHVPTLRELRFWSVAAQGVFLALAALAFTAFWVQRAKPETLAGWWWGCALSLGFVFFFAQAMSVHGGVTVNRGMWLLPGLTLTIEYCLSLHEKSLLSKHTGRECHEMEPHGKTKESTPLP